MTNPDRPVSGALRDLTVVEFGHYAAGPLVGMLLGDQGARVIKVERPEGDPARSDPAFAIWNRGKESVVLDLQTEDGRADAAKLLALADVVVENFRPGVADRLGIGYAQARQANPQVVYCSLPGFPPESPHRSEAGWDAIVGAATGTYQRGPQSTSMGAEATPLYTPLLLPSTIAAFVAAGAITAALITRQRSGLGQRIEVPLYSATFAATGMFLVRVKEDAKGWTVWQKLPLPAAYQCRDGRWIQAYGATRRHLEAMFSVFGHPEWTDDATAIIEEAPSKEVVDMWRSRFVETFRTRDSWDWEREISDAGGISVVCRSTDEWFATRHAYDAGLIVEVADPTWGPMKQPGLAVNLRATPGAVGRGAPTLGQHNDGALSRTDATATPSENQPAGGETSPPPAALEGMRVLDLSILLAGPSCGRVLGEYGADVIKVDDAKGVRRSDSDRTKLMWLDVNRGKRSVRLDLKSEAGREAFWRLVDTADVIVENFRAGPWDPVTRTTTGPTKLEKLGLGYEDIRARRPDIVYLSVSAFGRYGEFTGRGGYEQAGQAVTGVMVRHGGTGERSMALAYPYNDYGTGLVASFGVLLAMYERFRTGRGQRLDTSLAITASLLQSRYMFDAPGLSRNDLEGPHLLGESWSQQFYRGSDGWFMVYGIEPAAWSSIASIDSLGALAADERFATVEGRRACQAELVSALASVFETRPRDHWLSVLNAAGLAAAEHVTTSELAESDVARAAGLVAGRDHPGFGWVDHGGPVARLEMTPTRLGRPAPAEGADTEEVLQLVGYSSDEFETLREARIAG